MARLQSSFSFLWMAALGLSALACASESTESDTPPQDAGCLSSCEPGATRCSEGGFQVCAVAGSCTAWSSPQSCPNGQACQQGTCQTGCVSECAIGSSRCSGDSLQLCAETQPGCWLWGAATACPDGETCTNGICTVGCQSECAEGEQICAEAGYRTCGQFDGDSCLDWSAVTPCGEGESCSSGACAPVSECSDECQDGARTCDGEGYKVCGQYDRDECTEWSEVVACDAGLSCSGGECASTCTDDCAAGARRCASDSNGVVECGQHDSDSCLEYGNAIPCADGESCSQGQCAADCSDECARGSARCVGDSVERCGNFDGDHCVEWGQGTRCDEGETCSAGACVPVAECEHDCVGAARTCADNGVRTCGSYDADSCADWGPVVPCGQGELCDNGRCQATCADECSAGARRCSVGGIQTCGDFDSDACLDWSAASPCGAGQTCSNGECAATCSDECAANAVRCSDGGVQRCGNSDADSCLEWGLPVPCNQGQVCANGACAATCQDDCAAGSSRCQGDAVSRCGQFDDDSCLDWGAAVPCEAGDLCVGGACESVCTPECGGGATRCTAEGVQICGDLSACPRWGATLGGSFSAGASTPCPQGSSCSNGQCLVTCQDECAANETRCAAGGRQTCGQFDADSCREWSEAIACAAGQSCSNGLCLATCQDECEADVGVCLEVGEGVRACGQFDGDDCAEWGPETLCGAGQSCESGECVACIPRAEVAGNGVDDDCDGQIDEAASGTRPGWCNLQYPAGLVLSVGSTSELIYGQVFASGFTEAAGAHPNVLAMIGYGPDGTQPDAASWVWQTALYNVQVGFNDEYIARLTIEEPGEYDYAWRFSIDGGETWGFCDTDGSQDGAAYAPDMAGDLHVGASVWWAALQWPQVIEVVAEEPIGMAYGRVYQAGVTDRVGQGAGIKAQFGYGPDGEAPGGDTWRWTDAVYNVDAGDNDEYCIGAGCCAAPCQGPAIAAPAAAGEYDFAWRFSLDNGRTWTYADIDGNQNGFDNQTAGQMTVSGEVPVIPIQWAGNWGMYWSEVADCSSGRVDIAEPVTVTANLRDRAACRQIMAEVYAQGHTDQNWTNPALILGQVVRTPIAADGTAGAPQSIALTYYRRVGNNHEFRWDIPRAELDNPASRRYRFFFRFSGDGGATWYQIGQDDGPNAAQARTLIYEF